jgi:hypothetical protein
MKKLFIVLSLIATTFAANAQDDFRPTAGKKGFTFGLQNVFQNGSSSITSTAPSKTGSLLFKYYIADDLAVRAGINYSHNGTKTTDTLQAGNPTVVTKNSSSTAGIQLGIQKSFGEGRLEPYVGADVYFSKTSGKYDQKTTNKNGTSSEVQSKNASNNGGVYNGPSTNIGLIPVVGFNYYIAKGFAIGAEFGWGIIHNGQSKNATVVTTNSPGTSTTAYYNNQSVSNSWGTKGSGQLQVTVLF